MTCIRHRLPAKFADPQASVAAPYPSRIDVAPAFRDLFTPPDPQTLPFVNKRVLPLVPCYRPIMQHSLPHVHFRALPAPLSLQAQKGVDGSNFLTGLVLSQGAVLPRVRDSWNPPNVVILLSSVYFSPVRVH